MAFELPPLPYAQDALEPHCSAKTLSFHHGKHHQAYVSKTNELIAGTEHADKSLEEIIKSSSGTLFNQAAQVWNHTFFWNSIKPGGGGQPGGALATAIDKSFGSLDKFKEEFKTKSEEHTSELQSLMRISYAVFCLKKKTKILQH